MSKPSALDRILLAVAPRYALSRIRSRAVAATFARHFEAAAVGRRTVNYPRSGSDANTAAGPALPVLRAISRDLRRNNPWARRGVQVIANNTVGWGIVPKPGEGAGGFAAAWKTWAESTQCDADGRLTFYGMQRQIMETVAESGEILVRRRWRRPEDGLAIPLQLQLLEPDHIDTTQDNRTGAAGGPIIQGIEFDKLGRCVAFWLFPEHPGSNRFTGTSKRYPASDFVHVFRRERPGQVRGVPWLAPVIVRLRDFDEYEDASILRHKITNLVAAFITDPQGDPASAALGDQSTDAQGQAVESLEPGMIKYLAPGQTVEFSSPPVTQDGGFSDRVLRAVAAGLGVTYEDLTGDYSRVNYSSGRLGWLSHWANVEDWRWNMLVPQFCDPTFGWAAEAAGLVGLLGDEAISPTVAARWTPPARPMLDPDKEGLAYVRRVRSGAMTPSEMVREQGRDPEAHWKEYADDLAKLDGLGIWIDGDVRRVSAAGLTQARPGATGFNDDAKDATEIAEELAEAEPPKPVPADGEGDDKTEA